MRYPAPLSLEGRRAIVTGGTKGAGAAVVARLKRAGASVTAVARSRPDGALNADDFVAADIAAIAGAEASQSTPAPSVVRRFWCTSPAARVRPRAGSPP